jgi:hypothetical protein
MIPGGALLVALFFQSTNGAPRPTPDVVPTAAARLEVRGPAECISRGDVTARVAARSRRIQFVDDAAIYAQVVLTSTRPGNVVAELVLATPGAERPPRRFVVRSCAETADAVALIIAVTLDPTLKRTGGADTSTGDAATVKPDQPADAKPPAPPATVETPAKPTTPPATPARPHFGASVAGQAIFGPAPAVMPGVALYGMAALDRGGLWSPALFVGATHVWRNDLSEAGGTASFTLDAASVDACPLRLAWSRLVARPCATALIGRLAASGSDTIDAASAARPFAAAGAAVAAGFGTTVEVSVRLGIGVTLLRDSYYFGDTTFHRAGRITTSASLGVGLRWP